MNTILKQYKYRDRAGWQAIATFTFADTFEAVQFLRSINFFISEVSSTELVFYGNDRSEKIVWTL